eukprot:1144923-Pelagomonas_calceolata.AAC.2
MSAAKAGTLQRKQLSEFLTQGDLPIQYTHDDAPYGLLGAAAEAAAAPAAIDEIVIEATKTRHI